MHTLQMAERKLSLYIYELATKTLNQVEIRFYDLNTISRITYHEVLFYVLWEQKVDKDAFCSQGFLVGKGLCWCMLWKQIIPK